jgi:hypothetical protein
LNVCDFKASHTLIIQLEEFLADDQRINILKFNGEKHLTVTLEALEHLRVTVLQHAEDLLDDFEYFIFGGGGVNPFSQVVEKVLFIVFAVFLPPEIIVNGGHTLRVSIL